jgi:16S rRNA (adenine1518-N6/adenine1519-N6)-dimethyltransferase
MKRRILGQHYLIDQRVVDRIIASADILPDERVLEIGTGTGVLTKELVHRGASFEAFEVDKENHITTLQKLGNAKAKIKLGDAFKERPRFDVLVSSLPYSKSTTFVEWISQLDYNRAVVLLQEDFVNKIMAIPGTKEYRAISVIAQISSEVRVLTTVSRKSFSPPPMVNSLLISMKSRKKLTSNEILKIKQLFSLRRREVASVMAKFGITRFKTRYYRKRIYFLTPDEALDICNRMDGPTGLCKNSTLQSCSEPTK